MYKEILGARTENSLERFAKTSLATDFYLCGGTGLALHLGHRLSHDLDFFNAKEFKPGDAINLLAKAGDFSLKEKNQGTVHGIFCKTKISLLQYPYPLLFKPKAFLGIHIADPRDIGCMKLDAIASRGTKKDFIDLFFLLQEISLKELLRLFTKKYRKVDYNMMHVLRSITYFSDARHDPEPVMLKSYSWKKVEQTLEQEVKKLI